MLLPLHMEQIHAPAGKTHKSCHLIVVQTS